MKDTVLFRKRGTIAKISETILQYLNRVFHMVALGETVRHNTGALATSVHY